MANSKELTEQVMELHKKQTKEMKALEEQREEALKAGFTEEQAWKLVEIFFTNSTKKGIF